MITLTIILKPLKQEPFSWSTTPDGCYIIDDTKEMYLVKQPNYIYLGNFKEVLNGTFVGLPQEFRSKLVDHTSN